MTLWRDVEGAPARLHGEFFYGGSKSNQSLLTPEDLRRAARDPAIIRSLIHAKNSWPLSLYFRSSKILAIEGRGKAESE